MGIHYVKKKCVTILKSGQDNLFYSTNFEYKLYKLTF